MILAFDLVTLFSKGGQILVAIALCCYGYGLWQRKANLNFKSMVLDEFLWLSIVLAVLSNPITLLNIGNVIINIFNNLLNTFLV